MASQSAASRQFARWVTEDWLAVVVGLVLVALVITGIVKNIP